MASSVGFWNEKIEKGLALPDQDVPREIPDIIMLTEQVWRGGLPTISVFSELRTKSFLPTLALEASNVKGKEPSAALIQFDFKRKEPKNIFGKTPMPSVPEDMDTTLDNPDVPEASQRISTPQVDGFDISQQGRPQQPPAKPPVELHTGPHFEPHAEPHLNPHETELEVPESRQRISAPNADGYDTLVSETGIDNLLEQRQQKQQKQKQEEALRLQRQQQAQLQAQQQAQPQAQQQEQQQAQPQPRPQEQQEALKRKIAVKANKIEIRRKVEGYMVPNKRIKDNTGEKVYDMRERVDDTWELEIPQRPEACLEAPAVEEEELYLSDPNDYQNNQDDQLPT
uniref:Uncharacterized protein n=1 Tax=Fusarium oxysporum (strain Fo5176) TaxID=660025 RepID=A0A0D2YEM1_FUSOF